VILAALVVVVVVVVEAVSQLSIMDDLRQLISRSHVYAAVQMCELSTPSEFQFWVAGTHLPPDSLLMLFLLLLLLLFVDLGDLAGMSPSSYKWERGKS